MRIRMFGLPMIIMGLLILVGLAGCVHVVGDLTQDLEPSAPSSEPLMDRLYVVSPHEYVVEIHSGDIQTFIMPAAGVTFRDMPNLRPLLCPGGERRQGYAGDDWRAFVQGALMGRTGRIDSVRVRQLPFSTVSSTASLEAKMQLSLAREAIDGSRLAGLTLMYPGSFEMLDLRRILSDIGLELDSITVGHVTASGNPVPPPPALEPDAYVLCYESVYNFSPGAWAAMIATGTLGTCTAFVIPLVTWGSLDLEVRLLDRQLAPVWTKKYSDSFKRYTWLPLLPLGKVHLARETQDHYRNLWRLALDELAASGVLDPAKGH